MQSNVIAKTEWVHRRREVALLILCFVVLSSIIGISLSRSKDPVLRVGNRRYALEVASTMQAQSKGLSGRPSLDEDKGMIFIFQQEKRQCFWMKDMRFSLDMIWTDAHHKVVFLKKHLSPNTYPKTFCSDSPASFVIELSAGEADKAGIHKGQVLNF